jgi:hypothetical protein
MCDMAYPPKGKLLDPLKKSRVSATFLVGKRRVAASSCLDFSPGIEGQTLHQGPKNSGSVGLDHLRGRSFIEFLLFLVEGASQPVNDN